MATLTLPATRSRGGKRLGTAMNWPTPTEGNSGEHLTDHVLDEGQQSQEESEVLMGVPTRYAPERRRRKPSSNGSEPEIRISIAGRGALVVIVAAILVLLVIVSRGC